MPDDATRYSVWDGATLSGVRISVFGHGISLDLAGNWSVAEGWTDPTVQEIHGIYFRSLRSGLQIHVRRWPSGPGATLPDGLRGLVREQWSTFTPFDEVLTTCGALTVVGASFEALGQVVAEFFATDGVRLINAAMLGPRADVIAEVQFALLLLGSVRFEDDR